MNKIISFLLAIVLCMGILTISVSADADLLNTLGIKFDLEDTDSNMTREKFAKVVATLMGSGELAPCDTVFPDVDKENIYSGYIDFLASFGVISSGEGVNYNPERDIQIAEASKMLICAMSFGELAERKGGYPQGYLNFAKEMDFLNGVNFTPYLTEDNAAKLVLNAITSKLPSSEYSDKGVSYTYGNSTIMTDRMKVSGYKGTIEKVDTEKYTIQFKVSGNIYNGNPILLNSGEIKNYAASKKINIAELSKVPVSIWVNEAEEIIHVSIDKDVENVYGYVYSVNGNPDGNRPVGVSYIKTIELYDDATEYDASESFEINLNNATAPREINLINKFVRLVTKNDEILFVEAFDMTEGGIVKSVIRDKIEYLSGETGDRVLKDFTQNSRVFINGYPADWRDIREDSVMDYYQTDDITVITVSEKVITDVFYSIGDDYVEIGITNYLKDDVYFKTSNAYMKNTGFDGLLSKEVTAYFSPNGKVRYICYASDEAGRGSEFLGIVCGVEYDDFKEKGQIQLWVTEPEIEKIILNFEDLKFSDGITLDELRANSRNTDGDGVYKFKTNGKDKLLRVSKASAYYGLDMDPVRFEIGSFVSDTYAVVSANNKKIIYGNDTPVYALYNFEGDFRIRKLTWSDMNGRYTGPNKGKMTFFGEKLQTKPSLVVLGGDLSCFGRETKGILVEKSLTIDEEGNRAAKLKIIEATGEKNYVISEYEASFLPQFALLEYYADLMFTLDDIKINSITDLSGDVASWGVQVEADVNGYRFGMVDKVDSQRLFVDESRAYCFPDARKPCLIVSVDSDKTDARRFTRIDKFDILYGDKVYYNLEGGLVTAIFVIQ